MLHPIPHLKGLRMQTMRKGSAVDLGLAVGPALLSLPTPAQDKIGMGNHMVYKRAAHSHQVLDSVCMMSTAPSGRLKGIVTTCHNSLRHYTYQLGSACELAWHTPHHHHFAARALQYYLSATRDQLPPACRP